MSETLFTVNVLILVSDRANKLGLTRHHIQGQIKAHEAPPTAPAPPPTYTQHTHIDNEKWGGDGVLWFGDCGVNIYTALLSPMKN